MSLTRCASPLLCPNDARLPAIETGVHAPGKAAQSLPAAGAKSAWALLPQVLGIAGSPGATPEADQERSCGGLDGREGVAAVRSKD